ncbi:MAG: WXG100 family type VII secretion target [Bifidobacteriaceae bacterium]|jgi:WXG100 family type VII secretion target|nr:WXG100 family type VII secretion target [Bifidobacteriaceae bacterium]
MSGFTVNTEAITTANAAVRGSIASISSDVAAMNGHLAELQATWSGGAAAAFAATMEEWRAAQRGLETALESINTALASAGSTYADTEAANQALFAGR